MKQDFRVLAITLISFCLYFFIDEYAFANVRIWLFEVITIWSLSHILTYLLFGLPLFIGVLLIAGTRQFYEAQGLNKPVGKGIIYSFLFTLPMFIGYAAVFQLNQDLTLNRILISAVAAGFFEELYFRAFLFGMIFRFTRLGFLPAVFLGAFIFGSVHLYQSQDFGTLIGIFLTTFMGAILFAWLYTEWKFNIWIPVFLHLFMNLAWMMFDVSDNALGNLWANVFRYATVAFAIIYTIAQKRRSNNEMVISKQTIWFKSSEKNSIHFS